MMMGLCGCYLEEVETACEPKRALFEWSRPFVVRMRDVVVLGVLTSWNTMRSRDVR